MPQSTISHRMQELESNLGVRLLNRTSRRFGLTDAGKDFYGHAVAMLREAQLAETAIRHRLTEPTGTVRCTAGVATMQFAMSDIIADFLIKHPKVNIVAHAADRAVDIVGENFDIAVRAHSDPLPDSTPVIGVTKNGHARAYAMRALMRPGDHVHNDLLGGSAVTVTYCNLDRCVRVLTVPAQPPEGDDSRRPHDNE